MMQADHSTLTLLVCPVHGALSEREAEDASETLHPINGPDDDGMGEPYRCPIMSRSTLRLPTHRECLEPLVETRYERVA